MKNSPHLIILYTLILCAMIAWPSTPLQAQTYRAVEPLLRTHWSQYAPYNNSCPLWINAQGETTDQQCLTGCVATALAQVVNYHRRPACLQDTIQSYSTPHFIVDRFEPGTPIDWAHMLDDYSGPYTPAEAQAVADLNYMIGAVVHSRYGVESTAASVLRLHKQVKQYLGYQYAYTTDHSLYTPNQWDALIHHELQAGRPIVITGYTTQMGAHAFCIDGCDSEGHYHINWGYGGEYDGYYDIHHLTAFEPLGDQTELGKLQGFNINQFMTFMHPDAQDSLALDTVVIREGDITLDSICWNRTPDTNANLRADFYFRSHRTDTLEYTIEVMLNQPSDTARFQQAEYIGLATVRLLPGAGGKATIYTQITHPGTYILGYSHDDRTIPWQQSLTVVAGQTATPTFGEIETLQVDDHSLTFTLPVSNKATKGLATDLVTYCLFAEGDTLDMRHWDVLNLAPQTSEDLQMTFRALRPHTRYHLLVRCPWKVVAEADFLTSAPESIYEMPHPQSETDDHTLYDLSGRRHPDTPSLPHGIYIQGGKKIYR